MSMAVGQPPAGEAAGYHSCPLDPAINSPSSHLGFSAASAVPQLPAGGKVAILHLCSW